jgi:DUF1680 family protein
VQRIKLPRDAQVHSERSNLFDGIVTLKAEATTIDESDFHQLYRAMPPRETQSTLTAVPYFLWANRGQGSMVVWVPEAVG